jgi:hypothetical protein
MIQIKIPCNWHYDLSQQGDMCFVFVGQRVETRRQTIRLNCEHTLGRAQNLLEQNATLAEKQDAPPSWKRKSTLNIQCGSLSFNDGAGSLGMLFVDKSASFGSPAWNGWLHITTPAFTLN